MEAKKTSIFTKGGIQDNRPSIHGPRIDGSIIHFFAKKSQANAFAKRIGIPLKNVCHVQTRFQLGYTIFGTIGEGYLSREGYRSIVGQQ